MKMSELLPLKLYPFTLNASLLTTQSGPTLQCLFRHVSLNTESLYANMLDIGAIKTIA